ncbi:MAG: HipA domain-containing protein [Pseudomonadota bacterium]
MTTRQLQVLVNDQSTGHLREENDLWQFEYEASWRESPQAFDLSPALSRGQALHADGASHRPVQWYFDNLLPEESLREVIAKEAGLIAEDAFGLLACFGAESAGSLVLRDPEKPLPAEHGLKALSLAALNARILNLPNASLTRDAPKRMSLAGAQHKMLVVLRGRELFEPLPATPSTHILKPNHQSSDYSASVMNEFFTMRLAKALGLEVPAVYRIYAPQPVYIVERFDRVQATVDVAGGESVRRRHVIDTCQLLNKARMFKYTAANLQSLAEAIRHSRSKAATRLRLYQWVVFNVLVGNGDNHIKNISFTVDAEGINLAPFYDLLCTAVYETTALANEKSIWPRSQLALSLNDATSFANVTRGHLFNAAEILGLNRSTAARELDRLLRDLLPAADKLIAGIEASAAQDAAASPDPEAATAHIGGELRLLRAVRHIVLADMHGRLSSA